MEIDEHVDKPKFMRHDAVSYCANLTAEGYSDWRLPKQYELMMIWFLGGNNNVSNGDKNDTGVSSGSFP